LMPCGCVGLLVRMRSTTPPSVRRCVGSASPRFARATPREFHCVLAHSFALRFHVFSAFDQAPHRTGLQCAAASRSICAALA
jgi:hypothetical protein